MAKICYSALLVILILGCNDTTKKRSVPDIEVTINKVQSPLQQSIDRGAVVYKKVCSQCPRPSGKGIATN